MVRVLPVYYSNNYISLAPNETKAITIEVAKLDLKNESSLLLVDGWNIDVLPEDSGNVRIALNKEAQVSYWPVTGLPIVYGAK